MLAALLAFATGVAWGSGRKHRHHHPDSPVAKEGVKASPAPRPRASSKAPPKPVETVSDFHSPVPILMYHVIDAAPVEAPYPDLFVPKKEFEAQMDWLADHGYTGVTLADVFAAWKDGTPIAKKPVVVSFDDGYASHYETALPKLDSLGWPGVLNLKVETLDQKELTAKQVEEMAAAGWEIDSHTITHPDVSELTGASLRREVAGSKRILERRLGVPIDFFCYPSGKVDDEAAAAVERAGYEGATTTVEGLASPKDDPYLLPRIRVSPGDGKDGLAEHLAAAGA
jgi:peptidoglycan/xylan/chitin deacetylase (PgdA/CDA1 family)